MTARATPRPLTLLACVALATLTRAGAGEPPPAVGESRWLGGCWWQHLGTDERGRALWLHPHLDGVPEVFAAARGRWWSGSLGSRFDPARGTFERRFNAAEVLNELRAATTTSARREAARLLSVFLALHPAPAAPVYLRGVEAELETVLTAEDRADVAARVAAHRARLSRVARPGARALEPPRELLTADDHLAALIEDGFLDVAVVGGNSKDPVTAERHSGELLDELARELERRGFVPARFRRAQDRTLRERVVELLGRPVRVRVQLVGGSAREDRVRRAVAAFVEGLAFADVVLYLGHSNGDTGRYHLSEAKTADASFHVGAGGDDLARRCHLLGGRAHQLVVLHSCSSWPKYASPLAAFCDAQPGATAPGVVATTRPAYFDEFVPRYASFLDLLTRGAGPRALARALREAPRRPDAAPIVLRGALQPRRTFVVARGVRITRVDGAHDDRPVGVGSDGRAYPSTEVFPQDRPGDVVQVVTWADGLVGLRRDGRLLRVGPDTGGECRVASPGHLTLRFVSVVPGRLVAVDLAGRLLVRRDGGLEPFDPAPPAAVVAIGCDAVGDVVAVGAGSAAWAWRPGARRWEQRSPPERLDATPSLLAGSSPGDLWIGDALRGRRVDVAAGWEVNDPLIFISPPGRR